ncbi:MAG: 4-hydroxy-2-oxovalerate aldolase [Victivallaceae bacterium]
MNELKFFDSTLRDGSHAVGHQITKEWICEYCKIIDDAGIDTVIVGHGNGLGASSLQVGLSLLSDQKMLINARKNLRKTRLGTFMIPGFGTIHDNLEPALDVGTDVFCIAAHCTEADVTKQHIGFVKSKNKAAYGVLMSYHMTNTFNLIEEAKKMQSYGADGIIIMDSAGASTPDLVTQTISALVEHLNIPIAFHSHNNLGLAVSNALLAYQSGASIIDGTIRGFGGGAGNCPLEVITALLLKMKLPFRGNLYPMLDASERIVAKMAGDNVGIDPLCVISGLSGVFSAFSQHVKKAAIRFDVDPRDIFLELGKRKVVGGQEDMVIDVAMNIAQLKKQDNVSYLLESLL